MNSNLGCNCGRPLHCARLTDEYGPRRDAAGKGCRPIPQDEAGHAWQGKLSIAALKEAYGRHRGCRATRQKETTNDRGMPPLPRCPMSKREIEARRSVKLRRLTRVCSPADPDKSSSLCLTYGNPHGSPDERQGGTRHRSERRYRQG